MNFVYINYKNKRKRLLFLNTEVFYFAFKSLFNCNIVVKPIVYLSTHYLLWPTKFRNTCVLTGFNKVFAAKYRLSRHMLRKNLLLGLVPGVRKALW